MATPQVQITGTLQSIFGVADAGGTVVFTLVNYNGNVPKVAGTAILDAPVVATVTPAGTFSVTLYGNDVISPANTLYQVTFISSAGATVIANYSLTGSGTFDISQLSPVNSYPVPTPPIPSGAVLLNPTGTQTIATYPLVATQFQGSLLLPNDTAIFARDNSGNIRGVLVYGADDNVYWYGDPTRQSIFFQPNPATNTLEISSTAITAFGVPMIAPAFIGGIGAVGIVFSASPVFPGASGGQFELTLSGNVTSSTLTGAGDGQLLIFVISQDGTGGHAFTWPSNVKNADPVSSAPNSKTVQAFTVDGSGNAYPLGPATIN